MQKVVPLILLLFGFGLLWILYLNRSSSRIQEATIITAGVIIAALLFVTKAEYFEQSVSSVYFVDLKQKDFVLFGNVPILMRYYMEDSIILTKYKERQEKLKKDTHFNFPADHKAVLDMQAIAILEYLGSYYQSGWYVTSSQSELPSCTWGSWGPVNDPAAKKDATQYTKDILPASLEQNIFYDDLALFRHLTLPKGTKIEYSSDGDRSVEYRFYKKFSFDIRLKILFFSYIVGLGNTAQYIGLVDPEDFYSKDYGNFHLLIKCEAKFSRLRSWDPSVVRYKKWTKDLFDKLYDKFDWSVQSSKVKDYEERKAHQKIIQKTSIGDKASNGQAEKK
ncbi:hypothetical protein KKA24_03615 [Patescibacteria group bacterium]|nr:hypothetical protein [Patescibacteria group bacterium]